MSMDQQETFNWMRNRIYEELEPQLVAAKQEIAELQKQKAELCVRLAVLETKPIRDRLAESEKIPQGLMEFRLD